MDLYDAPVELRELEIFLVLAEELHFGRTAERLYLSQPRISQTVRALEDRVGGKLFERTSRRVSLTDLGQHLRDELQPGYAQIQRALTSTSDRARGVSGTLRMCVPTYSMAGPHFTEIARTFQARYPACRLVVAEEFPGDFDRLRQGAYDLMCHRQPISAPDLTIGPRLSMEGRILLVHVGHPLAERGHATAEDLGDYAVVSRTGIPARMYDDFFPATTPSGRPIPRGPEITMSSDVLHLVARGDIVHPTVASFTTYYRHPDVTSVPIIDAPPTESVLVWLTDKENAAIRAFATVATEVVDAASRH
jgi:DNA-binding transcriptional LysR family regulator